MPQVNRDKESIYPPGKLNLWFLGTSAVLTLVLVWMLADDYMRPWKGVQRDFFKRQAGILSIEKELRESELLVAKDPASKDAALKEPAAVQLKTLGRQIEEAKAALATGQVAKDLASWKADVAEKKILIEEAETRTKAAKGAYAERRFAYQMAAKAHEDEKAEKLRKQVDDLGNQQAKAEMDKQNEVALRDALQKKIDEVEKPLRDLEARRAALMDDVSKATVSVDAARAKTESDQWRNLPIADFLTPTIKIDKFVLDQIHDQYNFATSPKVDTCMTCHAGIDKPGMSEENVRNVLAGYLNLRFGEKAWKKLSEEPSWSEHLRPGTLKAWLSGAPKLSDVFPAEKIEAALGGPEATQKFRDRVLGGKSLEEGGRELLSPFAIRPVEWAHPFLNVMVGSSSAHPMAKFGCTSCHEGVGRRLDFVRAAHTPDDEKQEHQWRKEHAWKEPELVEYPMLPKRFVQGQCLKCHLPGVSFRPTPEPLKRWEVKKEKGKVVEDDKHNPVMVRQPAPKPVDGTVAEAAHRWDPATLEHGSKTVREYGCTGCHRIRDFGTAAGFPRETNPERGFDLSNPAPGSLTAVGMPKVAPDLTHVKDKTTVDWTIRWIDSPNSFRIDTRMPSFYRFRAHDDQWRPLPAQAGMPQDVPIVHDPTPRDLAQIDVETLALTMFLFDGQTGSRAKDYVEPPSGDAAIGKKIFYTSANCWACHRGPDDREGSDLPESTLKRFERREDLPMGPRLMSLGSKVNAKWLYAWLQEPRHYNSVTRMPNNRLRDETAADGKTVTRSAKQLYADLVAYLLQFRDKEFEAREVPDPSKGIRWTAEHQNVLADFWLEWYGKVKVDPTDPTRKLGMSVDEARTEATKLVKGDAASVRKALVDVGRGLVRSRGCFGCHNIEGYEKEQPIGKELFGEKVGEGNQDIHKFDFGILSHHDVPHTRWDWVEAKLRDPRIYDKDLFKPRWADKLRMPKFNFREEDRTAVTALVLGLVYEPIQAGALFRPNDRMAKIATGRAVVERYGCNNCHTVENRSGVLTAAQLDQGMEGWMLPPNLFNEGHRVKSKWLFEFLKTPTDVRPSTIQRMPMFRFSDAEVSALVDYFAAVSELPDRFDTDPDDRPLSATPYAEAVTIKGKLREVEHEFSVHNQIEEAKALFETFNCVKCHLPKGTPGADPNDGASAPPFTLSAARLRRAWTEDLLLNPQYQIQGTKMVAFWPGKRNGVPPNSLSITYPQFLCTARDVKDAKNDDVARAQMQSLVRYLLWHYEAPTSVAPSAPPEPK